MITITANKVISFIQEEIVKWHVENENRKSDYKIITDEICRIKPLYEHRDDIEQVIRELTITNTEMWHEEDKVRSMKDEVVLRAIRNINPLNQHRNDLIEEVDEIILDKLNQ